MKLKAKKLRESDPTSQDLKKIERNPIYFVLDEVLDTFNIGSMFRLADAVAAEKIYLCGNMETPPYHRIHKAAVGTEKWVPWKKEESAIKLIKRLKKRGVQIVSIEQDVDAIPYTDLVPTFPIALVLGHETKGVKEKVLKSSDKIDELPMHGINNSFNVWGSASIVAYEILKHLK